MKPAHLFLVLILDSTGVYRSRVTGFGVVHWMQLQNHETLVQPTVTKARGPPTTGTSEICQVFWLHDSKKVQILPYRGILNKLRCRKKKGGAFDQLTARNRFRV